MREAATAARDRGVNLAFLGGNEVYRHIRFADTPLGPNRLEINYKSFGEDPASRTDPREATPDWRQPPYPRPESVLTGNSYSCFPGRADLVATDPDNWLLRASSRPARSSPASSGRVREGEPRRAHPPADGGAVPLPRACAAPPTSTSSPTPSTTPPRAAPACSPAAPRAGSAASTPPAPVRPGRPRRPDPGRRHHPAAHHLRRRPRRPRTSCVGQPHQAGHQGGRSHTSRPRSRIETICVNSTGVSGNLDVPRVRWSRVAGFQATGWAR